MLKNLQVENARRTSDRFEDRFSIERPVSTRTPRQTIPNDLEDLRLALDADGAEDGVELEQVLLLLVDVLHQRALKIITLLNYFLFTTDAPAK
jgi:hypothetical protein